MIPAPGIEDQELSIAPERTGVNNPSITRRCDLGSGPGCQRNAFFDAAGAIGTAEIANFAAIDGWREQAFGRRERNRGTLAVVVLQGSQIKLAVGRCRDALQA